MKEKYINLFIDLEYPKFLDKYLNTKTLSRIQYIGQFCGCDYTSFYDPLFFYSRLDHSLVVAHMTWHFTHDKKETIAALLHDVGTPCFAHTIDYVFGDYQNQESSEKSILDMIQDDSLLMKYLEEDEISFDDLKDFSQFPILENKSPKLCIDRLDGVLHTCFIWLHTYTLEEIKEVYDSLMILKNEDGKLELGFSDELNCLKFVKMNQVYAMELQSNRNKYTMKYISDVVKIAVSKNLIIMDDLYRKREQDLVSIFKEHIKSWKNFEISHQVIGTEIMPENYFVSINTKKRNVIPLVKKENRVMRINECLMEAKTIYHKIFSFQDKPYAYVKDIKELD